MSSPRPTGKISCSREGLATLPGARNRLRCGRRPKARPSARPRAPVAARTRVSRVRLTRASEPPLTRRRPARPARNASARTRPSYLGFTTISKIQRALFYGQLHDVLYSQRQSKGIAVNFFVFVFPLTFSETTFKRVLI